MVHTATILQREGSFTRSAHPDAATESTHYSTGALNQLTLSGSFPGKPPLIYFPAFQALELKTLERVNQQTRVAADWELR